MPASRSQRRLPLTTWPRPGISTATSSSTASSSSGSASCSSFCGRNRRTSRRPPPTPNSTSSSWRSRNANGLPSRPAIVIDAEVTITSPSSTIASASITVGPSIAGPRCARSAARDRARRRALMPQRLCTACGEHLAAVRVVAKHVEAGARRRQQHRVAGLRQLRRALHRGRQASGVVQLAHALQRRTERARIAPDQHRRAHLAGEGGAQRREILALAVTARDHDQRAGACRPPLRASRRRWCPWSR